MDSNRLMEAIETKLPQASWSWVTKALQYDPQVWEALQGEIAPGVVDLLLQAKEGCPLAAIGLLAWGNPDPLQAIQNGLLPAAHSLHADSNTLRSTDPGAAWLATCLQQALQLHERSASQEGWEGLAKDLDGAPSAVLAFLVGVLPNPAELIAYLLAHHQTERSLTALLCNPMPVSWHEQILRNAMTAARTANLIPMMNLLAVHRPELLASVTPAISRPSKRAENLSNDVLAFPAAQVERLFQSITSLRLAGQVEQAYELLQQASLELRRLQARWLAEVGAAAETLDSLPVSLNAWRQAAELADNCDEYFGSLSLALIQSGKVEEAQAVISDCTTADSPAAVSFLLARATLAVHNNFMEAAREDIHKAISAPDADRDTPRLILSKRWLEIARLALSMGLAHDALEAVQRAESYQPQAPEALNLHAQAALVLGEAEIATQKSRLARLIKPQQPETLRWYAKSLEASERWKEALAIRAELMGMIENPDTSDWHDLAACALQAGDVDQAMRISQRLIEQQSSDGLAHVILGQSLAVRGESHDALEYLERATHLSPTHAKPWLALAAFYQQQGQLNKALDTLRAAAHTAPELYEIQLALGEAYLIENAPTQALAAFRTAGQLLESSHIGDIPGAISMRIELRLGQTLLLLGHLGEACNTLQRAYQANPQNFEAALGYGRALLALDNPSQAFEPILQALSQRPEDTGACLAFAECVLAMGADAGSEELSAARGYLEQIVEADPTNLHATALLAEILATQGDYQASLQAFQSLLETEMIRDMQWNVRVNLGLGKAALRLGKAETAMAALQEAAQADPLNANVQRQLCLACLDVSLYEDAYQSARTALALAATDLDTLVWFAEISSQLDQRLPSIQPQIQREAISAMHRAVQLAPKRSDLWLRLGELQLRAGEEAAVQSTLHRIIDLENPQIGDLYRAAQMLKTLGDFNGAAACLERALQGGEPAQAGEKDAEHLSLVSLLVELSDARQQAGANEQALSAIQQALQVDSTNPTLYIRQAGLLLLAANKTEAGSQERKLLLDQAIQAMEHAVALQPQDAALLMRVAALQRSAGNLAQSLAHALAASQASPTPSEELSARLMAAEIYQALLLPLKALQTLEDFSPQVDQVVTAQLTAYHCLRGELALQSGDVEKATHALVQGMEHAPEDSRLLALQSRLTVRRPMLPDLSSKNQPDWKLAAKEMLDTAISSLASLNPESGQFSTVLPNSGVQALHLALAEAALDLHQWEPALNLARQAQSLAPDEPYTHILVARLLTLRAEAQRFFQQLEALRRAPGVQALSAAAWNEFQQAIQTALELTRRAFGLQSNSNQKVNISSDEIHAQQTINRWRARGLTAFQPQPEHAQAMAALPPDPEDAAALIACLAQTGDLAMSAAVGRQFPSHPLVLAQLAIALAQEKPRQAQAAAQTALEGLRNSREGAAKGATSATLLHHHLLPLLHALVAKLFWNFGHRSGDRHMAAQSIRAALDIWPDEPRWHALAADIYLSLDQDSEEDLASKAIGHLEQALRLDPHQADFARQLGQLHLKRGRPSEAVPLLERACQLIPEDAQSWMALAKAHQARGENELASLRAERASLLAPDWIDPLLLRSELALAAGKLPEAHQHAQAVLSIDPLQPQALMIITRALQASGKSAEALAALDKALDQTGSAPLPLRLEKARLLHDAQGAKQSLQYLESLQKDYPQDAGVLALQAEYLEEAGELETAARTAQEALRARSAEDSTDDEQLFRLHHLVGRLLSKAGQLDQAVHHLSEAIHLRPENVEPYLELGQVHLERRQYSQAQRAFQQAIQTAPLDPRGYYYAGMAMKEGRDYLEAERLLRRASELAPRDLTIRRLLGAVVALNLVHNRRSVGQDLPTRGG